MQITLFLISVIIPSPTAASIGDDITVQKAPLLYIGVRTRKSPAVCVYNKCTNPLQNIYVLYATSTAKTPTHCNVICCTNTTQKKLASLFAHCYYMRTLNNNAA